MTRNKFRKIAIPFFLANFLIFVISMIACSMTAGLLPISLIGVWFIFSAITGLTNKVFETERLSELYKRSIQEISDLINIQLMLGDLGRADEASKILKEKAENMSV